MDVILQPVIYGEARDFLGFLSAFPVSWLWPFASRDDTKLRHLAVTGCKCSKYMPKHFLLLTSLSPLMLLFVKIVWENNSVYFTHPSSICKFVKVRFYLGLFCPHKFLLTGLENGSTQEGICRAVLHSTCGGRNALLAWLMLFILIKRPSAMERIFCFILKRSKMSESIGTFPRVSPPSLVLKKEAFGIIRLC